MKVEWNKSQIVIGRFFPISDGKNVFLSIDQAAKWSRKRSRMKTFVLWSIEGVLDCSEESSDGKGCGAFSVLLLSLSALSMPFSTSNSLASILFLFGLNCLSRRFAVKRCKGAQGCVGNRPNLRWKLGRFPHASTPFLSGRVLDLCHRCFCSSLPLLSSFIISPPRNYEQYPTRQVID